jgi:outer membrane protein assembly factor BamB
VSGAGRLLALAPDGSTKWSVSTGPSLKAAPALGSDGTVYLSSMNGKLYAVAPPAGGSREGTVRWTFDFAANPGKTPIVVAPTPSPGAPAPPPGANGVGSGASPTIGQDGTIYVGANNSNFYAVDPDSKLRWMYEAEREVAGIWSSAALSADEKTLYFGANKGGIYALDAQSGALRWRSFIYGSVYNSPSLDSKGVLYTGSTAGHVIAIDSASGKVLVDYDAGAPVWTVPAIRPDGSLVVGDLRGRIRTLG